MTLPEDRLLTEVRAMSREQLIDWLSWNDRNGIYRDEDSLAEFGNLMTKEEGEEIMFRQIMSERDGWDGRMDSKQIY
ncbi:hypothetical protein GCM10007415_40150 [Parapedobacter pyrenivorans]|uniref:Uncharacterized protein n=2 Tax=Parapedobacter pyrenivorans TaxID=1305674 RepID=A0A917I108_9SPHI|nr:hypothetical protein GCM10007415_40150 [Parapedobacter pyrenivorans]